ncbi:hypothetical protein GIB67_029130 [Kingdonia uniflora]|uniref:Uncharacterized protein n=1 Tax=Kingdonia uniflora TaxID=39325 RepID=A0A7J7N3K3_9MAGN|nr:hypothetical protein GIB67_029130 [Kingdonia uniflora]
MIPRALRRKNQFFKVLSNSKMQSKISSFFKPSVLQTSDTPQLLDPIPSDANEPEIRITYTRRTRNTDTSRCIEHYSAVNEERSKTSDAVDALVKPVSTSAKILNKKKRSYAQFHLELGQSDFLLHKCSMCGLKYARGDGDDEKIHKEYHKNYTHGIQFKGWRNERVITVMSTDVARIIMVIDGDPPAQRKKLQEVVKMMEWELGLSEGFLLHKICKVYLFISAQRIAGCLITEPISNAYRVIPSLGSSDHANTTAGRISSSVLRFGDFTFQQEAVKHVSCINRDDAIEKDLSGAVICGEDSVPAIFGVRVIWVAPASRRKHIATKLLDAARKSFCMYYAVEPSQLAFSPPTSSGKALASTYSGTESFLVYISDSSS